MILSHHSRTSSRWPPANFRPRARNFFGQLFGQLFCFGFWHQVGINQRQRRRLKIYFSGEGELCGYCNRARRQVIEGSSGRRSENNNAEHRRSKNNKHGLSEGCHQYDDGMRGYGDGIVIVTRRRPGSSNTLIASRGRTLLGCGNRLSDKSMPI